MQTRDNKEDWEEKIKGDISNSNFEQSWPKLEYEEIPCPKCKGKGTIKGKDKYDLECTYKCLACMGTGTLERIKE